MEQTAQVGLCDGDHDGETRAPQRADEPLTQGMGVRALWRRCEALEPQRADALIKVLRANALPVMEEETVAMLRRDRFTPLLQRPHCCGGRRRLDGEDTPRGVFHAPKHGEEAPGRRDHHTAVPGDDRLGMPILTR